MDFSGALDLAGLAGIVSAMGLFLFRLQKEERRERESMRSSHVEERKERDESFRQALALNRHETERFLGNHLSHIPKAMDRVADRLEALEAEAERAHRSADGR